MSARNQTSPATASEKPVLLEAINLTMRTMERRTRSYRILAVGTGLTILGGLMAALLLHRWMALGALLAAPLYMVIFWQLDARLLRGWRDRVLVMRQERGLDTAQLRQTLTALRYIPEGTLRSMFAMVYLEKPQS